MIQRLTRRRFGQIAIAGSAAAGLATLSTLVNKTSAQVVSPQSVDIIGVRSSLSANDTALSDAANQTLAAPTDTVTTTDRESTDTPSTSTSNTTQSLELLSLNVGTGTVQKLKPSQISRRGAAAGNANPNETTPTLQPSERITGLTALADTTLLVAVTPISTSKKGSDSTRLVFLDPSQKTVKISGLQKQEALESLLVLNDGSLVGLIVRKDGTPPVRLVDINPQTGEILTKDRITLPANQRFSNLAQCPDGKLYTTSTERNGTTTLVQLDLAQKIPITVAQLRSDNQPWNNGLHSLICSPAGQLFALGNRWHDYRQYLYTVDPQTGDMTRLQAFEAAKITFAPT